MKLSTIVPAVIAFAFVSVANAQQAPSNDTQAFPPALTSVAPGNGSFLSQFVRFRGFDVETPLGLNGCLGVEHAWGMYWVSSRGSPAVPGSHILAQFDTAGTLVSTVVQQNTGATPWGIRDLESDEAGNKLWGGQEGGLLQEYDRVAGTPDTLVFNQVHLIPGQNTVRALCRDNTGLFYTKNFNSALVRFTLNPVTLGASTPDPGKATYGLGYDRIDDTLWSFDQNSGNIVPPPPPGVDAVEINEVNKTTGALTGRGGWGVTYGIDLQNLAAGMDIYENDPLNPDRLSMIALHQFTHDEVNAYDFGVSTLPSPVIYCTAKLSSTGCLPAISATGTPSASAAAGFTLASTNTRNRKAGLLQYSFTGQSATPFGGGTLCVAQPISRTPPQNSNGTPAPVNDCSGTYSIDMNTFASGGLGGTPKPPLTIPGTVVNCQWIGRDPGFPFPNHISLSDAVEYTIGV